MSEALPATALDAAEPLGQEVDHPGRTDTFPFERGRLFVRHLPIIFVVAAITGLLAGVVTLLPGTASVPAGEALIVGVMASVLAACGAVVSVVQGAPEAVDSMAMTTPEIAGMRTVYRAAWPPGMAVIGTLPLIAARAAAERAARPTAGTETMAPIAAAVLPMPPTNATDQVATPKTATKLSPAGNRLSVTKKLSNRATSQSRPLLPDGAEPAPGSW